MDHKIGLAAKGRLLTQRGVHLGLARHANGVICSSACASLPVRVIG
jgi:hypothetical protein